MIEVESNRTIKASREAIWRHLTRASEWHRWYPGLHGTTATESIARPGQSWRSTGQMSRMLYRGEHEVREYKLLSLIRIEGRRYPWLSTVTTVFEMEPDGPYGNLSVRFVAQPGFWLAGRLMPSWILRRQLQAEANAVVERLADYVEHTLPYH